MSIVEVKVPQLSESVAEATMLQWKKKAGDTVSADEILIEIETDKVVLEVPAPAAGVLSEILVADGGTVIAEQLIARIDTDGKVAAAPASATANAAAPAASPVAQASAPASNSKAGVAMPAAAKLMADNNMAAGSVAGSGKDGRVTKGDVLSAVANPASAAVIPTGVPTKALPAVSGPAVNLGERPEQRGGCPERPEPREQGSSRAAGQLHIHCGLWVGDHTGCCVQVRPQQLCMECQGGWQCRSLVMP
jgi:2-oxoglutarate dehydrogenase E2 component (dihydrolipoamide succinyltransferase)